MKPRGSREKQRGTKENRELPNMGGSRLWFYDLRPGGNPRASWLFFTCQLRKQLNQILEVVVITTRIESNTIKVVINNHVLGMVRQWQNLFYGQRYSNTTLIDGVDFVKVAEGMGAEGMTVTTREELDIAIEKAFKAEGPFVIDCRIDSDEKVWPMVAPGAPIQEAFTDEDLAQKK